MLLVFIILLFAVISAWRGYRTPGLYLFAVSMLLATGLFIHHLSTQISIQL